MTTSQATVNVNFSNGSSQIYALDATDGTEGELLELISGNGIGSAAQGLTVVGLQAFCENQLEYVVLIDEVGVQQYSGGGCNSEAVQSEMQMVPNRTIGLNWTLKVLTAAS